MLSFRHGGSPSRRVSVPCQRPSPACRQWKLGTERRHPRRRKIGNKESSSDQVGGKGTRVIHAKADGQARNSHANGPHVQAIFVVGLLALVVYVPLRCIYWLEIRISSWEHDACDTYFPIRRAWTQTCHVQTKPGAMHSSKLQSVKYSKQPDGARGPGGRPSKRGRCKIFKPRAPAFGDMKTVPIVDITPLLVGVTAHPIRPHLKWHPDGLL
jgi:hypothetical protein